MPVYWSPCHYAIKVRTFKAEIKKWNWETLYLYLRDYQA